MLDRLKSVYLAWQSPSPHRRWYPVGLLEFERIGKQAGFYRFDYLRGALRAEKAAGFCPIDCFPHFTTSYESANSHRPRGFVAIENVSKGPKHIDGATSIKSTSRLNCCGG